MITDTSHTTTSHRFQSMSNQPRGDHPDARTSKTNHSSQKQKMLLSLVAGLGLLLVIIGSIWFFLIRPKSKQTTPEAVLNPVEKITISLDTLSNKALISTPAGIQVLDPASGNIVPLDPAFTQLADTVAFMTFSKDRNYWLMKQQLPDSSQWYLVDVPKQEIRSLNQLLENNSLNPDSITGSMWSSYQSEILFVSSSQTAEGETGAVTLSVFNAGTNTISPKDQLTAKGFKAWWFDSESNTVIFEMFEGERSQMFKKTLGQTSTQDTTTGAVFTTMGYPSNWLAKYTPGTNNATIINPQTFQDQGFEVPRINDQHRISPFIAWSGDDQVFAVTQWSNVDRTTQTVQFYTIGGELLYQLEVPNSPVIYLSADGQTAIVQTSQAVSSSESTTENGFMWYVVHPFTQQSQEFEQLQTTILMGIL